MVIGIVNIPINKIYVYFMCVPGIGSKEKCRNPCFSEEIHDSL